MSAPLSSPAAPAPVAAEVSRASTAAKVAAVLGLIVVIGLIAEKLEQGAAGGFIFDGFPRTLAQADALGALLAEKGESLDKVIQLQADDEVLVKRVVNRAAEAVAAGGKARADDNAEAMRTRLFNYYRDTSPLIGYYHAKGLLTQLDGLGQIDEVAASIRSALDS